MVQQILVTLSNTQFCTTLFGLSGSAATVNHKATRSMLQRYANTPTNFRIVSKNWTAVLAQRFSSWCYRSKGYLINFLTLKFESWTWGCGCSYHPSACNTNFRCLLRLNRSNTSREMAAPTSRCTLMRETEKLFWIQQQYGACRNIFQFYAQRLLVGCVLRRVCNT